MSRVYVASIGDKIKWAGNELELVCNYLKEQELEALCHNLGQERLLYRSNHYYDISMTIKARLSYIISNSEDINIRSSLEGYDLYRDNIVKPAKYFLADKNLMDNYCRLILNLCYSKDKHKAILVWKSFFKEYLGAA